MAAYRFEPSDILYLPPLDIMRYLTRKDLGIILLTEPNDYESLEKMEILLFNFEEEELYEECIIINKEIKRRVKLYDEERKNKKLPNDDGSSILGNDKECT